MGTFEQTWAMSQAQQLKVGGLECNDPDLGVQECHCVLTTSTLYTSGEKELPAKTVRKNKKYYSKWYGRITSTTRVNYLLLNDKKEEEFTSM